MTRVASISSSALKKLRGELVNPEMVVLPKEEIERIKENSKIMDKAEWQRRKEESEGLRSEKIAVAKARKAKMMQLEEERRAKAPLLSDMEMEQLQMNRKINADALQSVDEEKDAVKQMNQMILYAKCGAIRDAQLEEKKRIQEEIAKENARLDLMMEMRRVRDIQIQEEIEKKKFIEQKQGSKVIEQQIKEREKERQRQRELKEQEAQQMLDRIHQMELKEEEDRKKKIQEGKRLYKEVMASNLNQTLEKDRKKQQNIDEDRRIAAYILEKERKEAAYEAEMERIRNEKELEVARLRAAQEKASDHRAEIDALRAKRTQEAAERKWREKERQDLEKKMKIQEDLNQARAEQQRAKEQRLSEQAREERRIFERIISVQRDLEQTEKQKDEEENFKKMKQREEIKKQIQAREEAKYATRHDKFDEGARLKQALAEEQNKLEAIKQAKIEALKKSGLPKKYLAELERKKFHA